jgi:hypothetical protein
MTLRHSPNSPTMSNGTAQAASVMAEGVAGDPFAQSYRTGSLSCPSPSCVAGGLRTDDAACAICGARTVVWT